MDLRKKSQPYFVYLLQCRDGSVYTGITTDVERRFLEHQSKKGGRYTASHDAWRIIYIETRRERSDALKREAEIKSWRRKKKMALSASFTKESGRPSRDGREDQFYSRRVTDSLKKGILRKCISKQKRGYSLKTA
jgi:putative endonuclease